MTEWTTDGKPMGRLAQRFWGGVGQRIRDSGVLDDLTVKAGQSADELTRRGEYDLRWAYFYNDDLYGRLYRGGLRGDAMPVEWNPVPAVVAFYVANVLAGELAVQPVADGADGEALAAAVAQVWRWSNFAALKRALTTTAAVLGDVFVKVAERAPVADAPPAGVYLQDIQPSTVRWWDADERDFLTGIRIDTPRLTSIFSGEERRHVLVEVWRKTWPDGEPGGVRYYEIAPHQLLDDARLAGAVRVVTFEELGYDFIPIVWARVDTHWRRQVAGIDRYNALAWQAARLNRPLAVFQANAEDSVGRPMTLPGRPGQELAPVFSEEGEGVMGVVKLPGRSAMTWAGNAIDFDALNLRMAEVREGVIDGLPEYRVATLRGIQIAAETLQLLLNQAEQRALEMREWLERALARAQMMAISIAQVAEVAPGVFARERIGDYEDGRIEHVFAAREVFPKSAAAMAAEVAALVAAGASIEGAARVAGYDEQQVEALVNLSIATFPEEAR